MIESILVTIKKVKKTADKGTILMFFAAAVAGIVGGVIDLAYCTPNIPLTIAAAIIGVIVLARGFVRCFSNDNNRED